MVVTRWGEAGCCKDGLGKIIDGVAPVGCKEKTGLVRFGWMIGNLVVWFMSG